MTRDDRGNLHSLLSSPLRHAWVVGVLALFLSSLPYLAGYAAQTADRVFDGAVFGQADYYSHLAKMQQGLRGEWTYRLLHTSENHDGALLQTFYVALGHIARLTGWSVPWVYHLARIVFGAMFFVAVYRFIAAFGPSTSARRLAFALVAFSSGLGWLMQMIAPAGPNGISPIDFWLVDANSFFGLLMFPHFSAVTALLLVLFTRFVEDVQRISLVSTALLALLLTLIHPYSIVILVAPVAALGAWRALRRNPLPPSWWHLLGAALLGAAPMFAYSAIVFVTNPAFKKWGEQLYMPSPPPLYYVLGFGLVLALAAIGARRFVREAGERAQLTLIWIGAAAIMAYAPVGIQRRLIEGMHVALCLVAAYGLCDLAERIAPRARFVAVNFTLAVASLSNLYMVIGYTAGVASGSERYFHSADLAAAIDWLGAHSAWDDTVLASERVGGLIPALIGHRVALGHWIETFDYRERQRDAAAFFDAATSDAVRIEILNRLGVRYVVRSDDERAIGRFDPGAVDYLTLVYQAGAAAVFAATSSHAPLAP